MMNKQILIIGSIFVLIISSFSGCIDGFDGQDTIDINISGVDTVDIVNKPGENICLSVSGVRNDVTVTKSTNLVEVDLSGVDCIVRVSSSHSFSSDVSGVNSKIVYYD